MSKRTWTYTTIRDGEPVATHENIAHEDAVRAVYAAMYGWDHFRSDERSKNAEPAGSRK